MAKIHLRILCAIFILLQNFEGSWGTDPSSSRGRSPEEAAARGAKTYLVRTADTLNNLNKERLEATRKLHDPSYESRKPELEVLAERLEKKRNTAEGKYLRVLKGYPVAGSPIIYVPGSEERDVNQSAATGEELPPIPVDNTKRQALTGPSNIGALHSRLFQQPEESIGLQNYVRLHHDLARIRLENLENAYEQKAKVLGTPGENTYDRFIGAELLRLEEALQAQREALLRQRATTHFRPQERKRTEEKIRELFEEDHLDYNNLHRLPSNATENTVELREVPPHAAKLRNRERDLFPPDLGFAPFRSENEALRKSFDDIDILSYELSVTRAKKKEMRNPIAEELYEESIKRLEDRIEMIRRNIDKIISDGVNAVRRFRYIPGSEEGLLKHAFRRNRLNWDREHAQIRRQQ